MTLCETQFFDGDPNLPYPYMHDNDTAHEHNNQNKSISRWYRVHYILELKESHCQACDRSQQCQAYAQ